jgi:hypothetical protein
MSDPLYESHYRKADTELGKAFYAHQRNLMYLSAYGSMYLSLHEGEEFSILEDVVRQEWLYSDDE